MGWAFLGGHKASAGGEWMNRDKVCSEIKYNLGKENKQEFC